MRWFFFEMWDYPPRVFYQPGLSMIVQQAAERCTRASIALRHRDPRTDSRS